jgi:hypothetical protein
MSLQSIPKSWDGKWIERDDIEGDESREVDRGVSWLCPIYVDLVMLEIGKACDKVRKPCAFEGDDGVI